MRQLAFLRNSLIQRFSLSISLPISSLIFLLVFSWGTAHSFSGYGFQALGEENWPSNARMSSMGNAGAGLTDNGFMPLNPASMDFNEKMVFGITGQFQEALVEEGDFTAAGSDIRFTMFNMSVPAGFLGSFGVAYWQRYTKSMDLTVEHDNGDIEEFQFEGGFFEIVPSWSFRLPYPLRKFSVGLAMHIPLGSERNILEFQPEAAGETLGDEAASQSSVIRKVESKTEGADPWGYIGGSVQYHTKNADFFFSFTQEQELNKTFELVTSVNRTDSLVPDTVEATQYLPPLLGTGVVFRFSPRLTMAMDYFSRNWNDSKYNVENRDGFGVPGQISTDLQRRAGLGVEYGGTGRFFDPFYKKLSYRMGIHWQNLYIGDVDEFTFSLGSGVPLGRRGASLDFAVYGGMRLPGDSSGDSAPDETFWGLNFSLTGLGNWGQASRRYR